MAPKKDDDNLGERLARVETAVLLNNQNVVKSIDDFKEFMVDYTRRSSDQRTEMNIKLTTVATQQEAFAVYQALCDTERKGMKADIAKMKTFQRDQKIVAGGIAGAVSFLAYGGGKLVEKVGAWFTS